MKWIEIAKAKPVFKKKYLIKLDDESKSGTSDASGIDFSVGKLIESKITELGLEHLFEIENGTMVGATHIALISDPSE